VWTQQRARSETARYALLVICVSLWVPFIEFLDLMKASVANTILQVGTALHRATYKGFLPLARLLVERAPHLLETSDTVSACVRLHVCV
jgi:hypothetical protein